MLWRQLAAPVQRPCVSLFRSRAALVVRRVGHRKRTVLEDALHNAHNRKSNKKLLLRVQRIFANSSLGLLSHQTKKTLKKLLLALRHMNNLLNKLTNLWRKSNMSRTDAMNDALLLCSNNSRSNRPSLASRASRRILLIRSTTTAARSSFSI